MGYKNFNTLNNIEGAYVMLVFFGILLLITILLGIVISYLKRRISYNKRYQLNDEFNFQSNKIVSYKIRSYSFLQETLHFLKDFLFLTAPIRLVYE